MTVISRTEATRHRDRRPAHPSLLPEPSTPMTEACGEAPAATRRHLPGGGTLLERHRHPTMVELSLVGAFDAHDRGAVVDTCTALTLEGARHLRIDAAGVESTDMRILEALAKIARFCARIGGSFELTGLREPCASLWAGVAPTTTAPPRPDRLDDRVVPLHARPSPRTPRPSRREDLHEPSAVSGLRIVADHDTTPAAGESRPA